LGHDQDLGHASGWLKKFGFSIDEFGNGRIGSLHAATWQRWNALPDHIRNYKWMGRSVWAQPPTAPIIRASTGRTGGARRGFLPVRFHDASNRRLALLPSALPTRTARIFLGAGRFRHDLQCQTRSTMPLRPGRNGANNRDSVGAPTSTLAMSIFFRSFFGTARQRILSLSPQRSDPETFGRP